VRYAAVSARRLQGFRDHRKAMQGLSRARLLMNVTSAQVTLPVNRFHALQGFLPQLLAHYLSHTHCRRPQPYSTLQWSPQQAY
jgi:hypothetical protein